MYGVSAPVTVKTLEPGKRLVYEWPGQKGQTTVEFLFEPHGDGATFVSVTESGFAGDGDELLNQALDSTGGFTWALAGLKALLEHGIQLNLVADRFPGGLQDQ
jgi:uncharacterized protein YndB with AHSA1/START domain